MTFIGKLLVFVVLVAGIGAAVAATAVYTQRPPYFAKTPDAADKGHSPVVFAQMTAEIDAQGRTAAAASRDWGGALRALEAKEKLRADRNQKMFGPDGYLAKSRTGNPGFFDLPEDPATHLLDLDAAQPAVVKGSDGALRGADTLLQQYSADAAAIAGTPDENNALRGGLTQDIAALQAKLTGLGADVQRADTRRLKQLDIRDNLLNEADYLATLEVNVAEQLSTAKGRRAQLLTRLSLFSGRD